MPSSEMPYVEIFESSAPRSILATWHIGVTDGAIYLLERNVPLAPLP